MFTLGFFFSFDATPGALVILQGENFGNVPGQAWIHLERDGKPADYQLEVTPNDWGDTFVAGIVPSISGVLDQQATFTVVAQCGATSNAVSGSFVAARDVVDLAYVGDPPPDRHSLVPLVPVHHVDRTDRRRHVRGFGKRRLAGGMRMLCRVWNRRRRQSWQLGRLSCGRLEL